MKSKSTIYYLHLKNIQQRGASINGNQLKRRLREFENKLSNKDVALKEVQKIKVLLGKHQLSKYIKIRKALQKLKVLEEKQQVDTTRNRFFISQYKKLLIQKLAEKYLKDKNSSFSVFSLVRASTKLKHQIEDQMHRIRTQSNTLEQERLKKKKRELMKLLEKLEFKQKNPGYQEKKQKELSPKEVKKLLLKEEKKKLKLAKITELAVISNSSQPESLNDLSLISTKSKEPISLQTLEEISNLPDNLARSLFKRIQLKRNNLNRDIRLQLSTCVKIRTRGKHAELRGPDLRTINSLKLQRDNLTRKLETLKLLKLLRFRKKVARSRLPPKSSKSLELRKKVARRPILLYDLERRWFNQRSIILPSLRHKILTYGKLMLSQKLPLLQKSQIRKHLQKVKKLLQDGDTRKLYQKSENLKTIQDLLQTACELRLLRQSTTQKLLKKLHNNTKLFTAASTLLEDDKAASTLLEDDKAASTLLEDDKSMSPNEPLAEAKRELVVGSVLDTLEQYQDIAMRYEESENDKSKKKLKRKIQKIRPQVNWLKNSTLDEWIKTKKKTHLQATTEILTELKLKALSQRETELSENTYHSQVKAFFDDLILTANERMKGLDTLEYLEGWYKLLKLKLKTQKKLEYLKLIKEEKRKIIKNKSSLIEKIIPIAKRIEIRKKRIGKILKIFRRTIKNKKQRYKIKRKSKKFKKFLEMIYRKGKRKMIRQIAKYWSSIKQAKFALTIRGKRTVRFRHLKRLVKIIKIIEEKDPKKKRKKKKIGSPLKRRRKRRKTKQKYFKKKRERKKNKSPLKRRKKKRRKKKIRSTLKPRKRRRKRRKTKQKSLKKKRKKKKKREKKNIKSPLKLKKKKRGYLKKKPEREKIKSTLESLESRLKTSRRFRRKIKREYLKKKRERNKFKFILKRCRRKRLRLLQKVQTPLLKKLNQVKNLKGTKIEGIREVQITVDEFGKLSRKAVWVNPALNELSLIRQRLRLRKKIFLIINKKTT